DETDVLGQKSGAEFRLSHSFQLEVSWCAELGAAVVAVGAWMNRRLRTVTEDLEDGFVLLFS
ncbi:hypothetical protein LINPERHAP2_LOCUS9234, partial [Linum perenne]